MDRNDTSKPRPKLNIDVPEDLARELDSPSYTAFHGMLYARTPEEMLSFYEQLKSSTAALTPELGLNLFKTIQSFRANIGKK